MAQSPGAHNDHHALPVYPKGMHAYNHPNTMIVSNLYSYNWCNHFTTIRLVTDK